MIAKEPLITFLISFRRAGNEKKTKTWGNVNQNLT